MEILRPQASQRNFEREEQVGGLTQPDFKTYYRATVIKIVWYLHKDRYIINQQKRESRNGPYIYNQLIFNNGARVSMWNKMNVNLTLYHTQKLT